MKHRLQLLAVIIVLQVIIVCLGGCPVDSSTSAKVSQAPPPEAQAATVSPQQLRASFSQALQSWCTSRSGTGSTGIREVYFPGDYDIINSDSALYPYEAVANVQMYTQLLDSRTGQWTGSEPMQFRVTFRGDGQNWDAIRWRLLR